MTRPEFEKNLYVYDDRQSGNAKKLRRSMTPEEKHLWYDYLKKAPFHVYKQRPVHGYIVDFYIPSVNLVIELDGSQHYSTDGRKYDRIRTEVLEANHLSVIRFTNTDIHERFESVCLMIEHWVKEHS